MTIRAGLFLVALCAVLANSADGAAQNASRKLAPAFSGQFTVMGGKVEFPHEATASGNDATTDIVFAPAEMTFPQHIRGMNQLLHTDPISTPDFDLPDDARTVNLTARSTLSDDTFAQVRVVVEETASTQSAELFRGYFRSLTLHTAKYPVPPSMQGRRVRVRIELLNPSQAEGLRCLFIREIRIVRGGSA